MHSVCAPRALRRQLILWYVGAPKGFGAAEPQGPGARACARSGTLDGGTVDKAEVDKFGAIGSVLLVVFLYTWCPRVHRMPVCESACPDLCAQGPRLRALADARSSGMVGHGGHAKAPAFLQRSPHSFPVCARPLSLMYAHVSPFQQLRRTALPLATVTHSFHSRAATPLTT
jgi:hypothetical protein